MTEDKRMQVKSTAMGRRLDKESFDIFVEEAQNCTKENFVKSNTYEDIDFTKKELKDFYDAVNAH